MSENLPPWLIPALPVSEEDKEKYTKMASNWMILFKNRSKLTELDCLKVIVVELRGRKRPEIVGRVRIWFSKLREGRELKELWASHPGAGVGHQGRNNARKGR